MAETDVRIKNRQRKQVVAASAGPEVVSRENFTKRREGMMSDTSTSSSSSSSSSPSPSSSSAVVCVNCNKERSHNHSNVISGNHNTKRKPFTRVRGKGNGGSCNNNRRKQQQQQQIQQQQQMSKSYSPTVVHLKDAFRPKRNNRLMKLRKASVDVDSDASSSKSTDEDQGVVTYIDRHGREEEVLDCFSSVSDDLASSPETVSYLQSQYHQHAMRPYRVDRYRKMFGNNNQVFSLFNPHQFVDRSNHSAYSKRGKARDPSRKNLTAFISELEKAHEKTSTKDIEVNLSDNAPDGKQPKTLLNNHVHCDCKDEGLNNVCKYLLKDVEIKRKNVAESDNVELICNDLFTSSEKLSEESTDESDTSDKTSELSSSDALSDDVSSTVTGVSAGRKFSAEALEDFVEYATGAPLVQYDYSAPECVSCTNTVPLSYPYYYSYYDAFESHHQATTRYVYDYHHHQQHHTAAVDPRFPPYHYAPTMYFPRPHVPQYYRHPPPPHRRRQNRQVQDNRYRLVPWQQCNSWIIELPRSFYHRLASRANPDRPSDIETILATSSSPLSTASPMLPAPLSSARPTVTASGNTVVTVSSKTSLKSYRYKAWKQRSKSESDSLIQPASTAPSCPSLKENDNDDNSNNNNNSESNKKEANSKHRSDTVKARRNGFRDRKHTHHSWDATGHQEQRLDSPGHMSKAVCNNNNVFMDLSGLDVKFTVFYPGDQEYVGWPAPATSGATPPLSSHFPASRLWTPQNSRAATATTPSSSCIYVSPRHGTSTPPSPPRSPPADVQSSVSIESEMQKYELAMPSNRPWINQAAMDKDVPAAVFTVMCYNVLSDKLCTKAMYGYCPTWALSWDYRKKGIMNDIINGNADIITLQEVETEQYYGLFSPELTKRGYEGIFLPKSRVRTMNSDKEKMSVDGCAIFYKKTKFEKVNEHHIEFSQLATKDGASNTDSDMINRVSTKDNIAIVAMLRTKPAAYDNSPVPAPKGLSQMLMVSTAHIHWDPQLPDVKLVQTIMLVEELRKFIKEASVQFRPNAPPPSVDSDMCSSFPLILCGDFNSLPDSGVFEFLSKGKLDTRHRDFDGQNYKAFMKDRNENGILNHKFNLSSAYKDVIPFTNYTFDFKGVIDYIFYSGQHFRLHGVMGLQDEEWFRANKIVGCPHPFVPSDHFPLFAEFSLPVKQAGKPR